MADRQYPPRPNQAWYDVLISELWREGAAFDAIRSLAHIPADELRHTVERLGLKERPIDIASRLQRQPLADEAMAH